MTRTGPRLILFTAQWAPVSRHLHERVVAQAEKAGVDVVVYDVDSDSAMAETWRVISVPTLIAADADGEKRRAIGAVSAETVQVLLDRLIPAAPAGKSRRKPA